jgi:transitional endoplasmic reticulum ATPase
VQAIPTPGFFGPNPPATLNVNVDIGKSISVVWGRFVLPGIDGFLQCQAQDTSEGPRFQIVGSIKRKDFAVIRALALLTRQIAKEESIYRGKAIKMEVSEDGDINYDNGIHFLDITGIDPAELIFSATTERQIVTSLWTPIEQTELCRIHKIPLKRGILLEGPYGTGKTLTSTATAIRAVKHGWTFLTINRVSGLSQALHFARKFQPCVIFAEDIDRVVAGDDRTTKVDDVLNTIDGIGSKNTEIMVVLTTNHIENINRAMLRPGRLDAVISVTAPDAEAVKKLVRLYGRSLILSSDPLEKTSVALAGTIPAMIRECVERSKLYAIGRSGIDAAINLIVTDDDICSAAAGMKAHMALLDTPIKANTEPSIRDIFVDAMKSTMLELSNSQNHLIGEARSTSYKIDKVSKLIADTASSASGNAVDGRKIDDIRLSIKRIEKSVSG